MVFFIFGTFFYLWTLWFDVGNIVFYFWLTIVMIACLPFSYFWLKRDYTDNFVLNVSVKAVLVAGILLTGLSILHIVFWSTILPV